MRDLIERLEMASVDGSLFEAQTKKISKARKDALIKAYARMKYSAREGAPVKSQQMMHDRYMALLSKLEDEFPHYDLRSDAFDRGIESAADKWWNSQAFRGSGKDW